MSRRVFTVATALALVHAFDDAFVHRGPGLGLGQHALAGLIALAAGIAAIVAFPRLRPGLRAGLAFSFGVLALVNGALHIGHIDAAGLGGGDVTGVVAALAGVVLIGLAAVIPWQARGAGTWRSRTVVVPAGLLATIVVLGPVAMGIGATHKWREPVGAAPSAAYEDVSFEASDGLELAGWYRPSQNGAAVVVVHGGSSDRKGSVAHASMLARHGYGVLVYDARGRGESEGSENNYGWDWSKDIAGALDFLAARDDVDPSRIGAVGLSTGADALIDVAPDRARHRRAGDRRRGRRLVRGLAPPARRRPRHAVRLDDVRDDPGALGRSAVAAAGRPGAADRVPDAADLGRDRHRARLQRALRRGGSGPVEHWNLPEAVHTRAIRQERAEYERRVVSFLDAALAA